jgi:hypothetical protein
MGAISELGFGKDNLVLDGKVRVEAAKALASDCNADHQYERQR